MPPITPVSISSAATRDSSENSVCSSLIKDLGAQAVISFSFSLYTFTLICLPPPCRREPTPHLIAGGFLGNPLTAKTPKLHISIPHPTSHSNKRWLMKQGRNASALLEITPQRQVTNSISIHGKTMQSADSGLLF